MMRGYLDRMMRPFRRPQRVVTKQHVGCNATTCPNGKCRATGECVDRARASKTEPASNKKTKR